ncbi:16S rRNA (guanine(966)-N(2))-methyltransferase RsmD [Parasulfitobacter algicola]|uniref:16S rRNA (Guanine(966)-N(2))-methyltransferase RsmD n=1 Tax=Parasulfitobacter algicola TaxID=2614809 RepID=A0ABX2INF5_9RHOB|nr:16S rRNA (guanine(966)-N(2))-methyltransferase RsmD [Sulfitobacter algicola]NSX54417.1 16S rRNA (guanine(966)-N(2))-methyltransferase RsmD [Sulfitobacter algicola]
MRIIAGTYRGLTLASVGKGDANAHLRPTSDRVRESLFSVLMSLGDPIDGARVLDLFAGTGALGLEALSRGATFASFVDNGAKARSLIQQNIKLCRAEDQTSFIRRDATRMGDCINAPYDVIFLDPPYGKSLGQKALHAALMGGWLTQDALIVWEENSAQDAPDGFEMIDQRRYGDTHITLLRRTSA